jgi:hypothetical protein
MEAWTQFTVITGGAAAALVGLLFVAVSIRAELIAHTKRLRARLAKVLTIFLGLLVSSIAIALPNPTVWILGIELIAVSMVMSAAFLALNRRSEHGDDRQPLERVLDRLSPTVTTAVLTGVCGVALLFGIESGLFVFALAAVVGFVGGVTGAWLVLVRPNG